MTSLASIASRALNAPSEAEYRGPSREFLITQACLNVDRAGGWKAYLSVCPERWLRNNWLALLWAPDSRPARVIAEFNRLQALHSFKDAGVGK